MLGKTQLLSLFFCCILCSSFDSAAPSSSSGGDGEVSALLPLRDALTDPLNRLRDWKLPQNANATFTGHCNWPGVQCNSDHVVERLDLSHWNLSGTIPDDIIQLKGLSSLNICCNAFSKFPGSLTNLTSLSSLDVSQNLFMDRFPIGFGRLFRLTYLNASSNNFSGFIPKDLSNLTSLESLDLRGNFLQGSIPGSFKNLQMLKFMGLSGNNLTGQIPPELGQLSSLESIILGYNEFDGGIPKEFGNLTNLTYLDLAVGNLGGEIPAEIGRLQMLETIFLYNNNFEGDIPSSIGNISSLKLLDLSFNQLSGAIPMGIAELKNLELLNLMCNQLSGSIPSGLGELAQLQVLELWNNSFSGPLPGNLGRSSPLQWLDVSSNSFSGEVPASLCSRGNLTKLILFNNVFTGPLPASLSRCSSLVRVRIQNNLLSGTIPSGFGRLGKLQRLELANNSLTGDIPNDIASSTSLSFIDFSRNLLRSSLPSTILSIPNLQTFSASNNNLFGEIPDQFQDCPSLAVLDLSWNHISGSIPASIASCEKLVNLNLRSNNLTGEIPTAIAMMPTLAILDLSNNSLTGGIPENFGTSPALEVLNVSYNRLEGPVPFNGVLRTINPNDLVGNVGLCGGVLPPCPGSSALTSKQNSLHSKHVLAGWIIGISSALAIGVALFSARAIYQRWYSKGNCFEERLEMDKEEWPWRLMAFQRLGFTTADILSSIREPNVIGMGATGMVYKTEIPRLGTVLAVKKLWRSGNDIEEVGHSDYLVGEVKLLGRLRHRNIVRLLGFLHNNKDMMIVYEFMHNGSLGEALHGKQAGKLLVDWVSRYNVAVGVAQGLAYLHHDCHPPVIHRDVKSSNILLDANLDARIADFGLAKMMLRKNETVSMVAGSYGYIAPEYGYTLKVDEKIDIYSFGIVLLELVTGRRPLDSEFGESVDIMEWIRRKIRDNRALEETLDPNIGNCQHVQVEMLLVLRIALLCTAKLPRDRPSMRDVIMMLGEAKPRRKSSSNSIGSGNDINNEKPIFSPSPVNGLV
ncbi:MDIS1-interacting receptor like kinase 1 [Punica granatum]|uniref:Protein kinase domain-containing protein n=2 Tax=Punica granatum TaxID=22663 RepID=A0A218Y099_PUNGR|nr:MDIS1-interacting receptor like kinase 1 [Punica granatum]OWM90269.1 hypothetical protein CDL15_Pgr006590 [Punica granatum]PKI72080.1 hypothetical protein CRG98_007537 [Punica granatum]